MEIYLVGGAVRDKLLNLPVHEHDWVVVGAEAQELINLGYQPVGKDFPVFLHPKSKEEYALARTERKKGKGYTGFACYSSPEVSLEDDLMRRDLTVNAMAQNAQGKIIDPYGGQHDCQQRLLRHVSAAFEEDPLRVLRVARFHAKLYHLGFSIAPETQTLLMRMVRQGELQELTPERVWLETEKALKTDNPQIYFMTLRRLGALKDLFPSLDHLFGVPTGSRQQPYIDAGISSLEALQSSTQFSTEVVCRFAALCVNVPLSGLPANRWLTEFDHPPSYEALMTLKAQYHIPNQTIDLAKCVIQFHRLVGDLSELTAEEIVNGLTQLDAYRRPQRFAQLLIAYQGVPPHHYLTSQQKESAVEFFRQAQSITQSVTPSDLEEPASGAALGQQITQHRIQQVETLRHQLNVSSVDPE